MRKQPLIVISHGNWGSRFSQGWLALELVKSGYVVLSTSHPGTVGDDQSVAGRYRLWDRSRDVSFALDEVLRDPKWAALIDEDRIGFVGHSFGGWTGVSLAGGRYDPARQRAFCASAEEGLLLRRTRSRTISPAYPAGRGRLLPGRPDQGLLHHGLGPGTGFRRRVAEVDQRPIRGRHRAIRRDPRAGDQLDRSRQTDPGRAEVVRPVGHFAYVPECRWLVGPILTRLAGLPLCDDPSGVDRALVHRQVAPDVVAFFDRTLARTD